MQEAANLAFIDSELTILKKLLSSKRSREYIRKLVDSQQDFCLVIAKICKSTRLSKIQREELVSIIGRYTGTLYDPNLPLEKLADFLENTNTKGIPYNLFLGPKDWMQVAGISLPLIMYIENGIVRKKSNGIQLDQEDIEAWLKK